MVFAFPVFAQLGIRMTPAIARATDFRFRVMFIVLSSLLGQASGNGLEMRMQDKTALPKNLKNHCPDREFFKVLRKTLLIS